MKKLAALMRQRGLSQKQLAQASGVSQPHISAIVRDEKHPSLPIAQKIANALGVSVDALIDKSSSHS